MKNNTILVTIFLVVIIFFLGVYNYHLNNEINDYQEKIENLKTEQNNDIVGLEDSIEHEYDCSFTETWRIIDTLDGYIAEVPELSYVVMDKFQTHSAYSYYIPSELKNGLEVNKYYEFTYSLKGTGIINDMDDVYSYMIKTALGYSSSDIKVTLSINETSKQGLEQLNEPICK